MIENERLVDATTGEHFPIEDGIPVVLHEHDVVGNTRIQRAVYDRICKVYDYSYRFDFDGLNQWLDDLARIIEVDPDDWVLETSIGSGRQCKNLYDHGKGGRFFGNDISHGMLTECRRNIRAWDLDIGLVQGNAEALPFQNSIFDVVFHVGAFNSFTDKRAALSEMVRVAKPGANIHISDVSTDFLDLSPTVSRLLPDRIRNVTRVPTDLVPPNTRNISVQMLWNGLMWVLSFQKQPQSI